MITITLRRLVIASVLACFPWSLVSAEDAPLRDAVECRARLGLPNFLSKVRAGQSVRIGYLGGSITAQAGWRPKTLDWFRSQFPKADISEINAAIGGTGSDLGVFRLRQDVLDHKPDLLFVEFAVNDGGAPVHRIHQAMEGIVRQTLTADAATDICFVYTLVGGSTQTLRDGKFLRAESAMEDIADHYGIPSIHMGLAVARLEGEGKLVFKGDKPKTDAEKHALGDKILFSPDNVHPYTDTGHELYLQAVIRSMAQIDQIGTSGPHQLPDPFTPDNWEAAKMVSLSQAVLSPGWKKLDPATNDLARRFQNRMPEMYSTNQPGQTITIRFKGTRLAIYDLVGPDCGQVKVTVDYGPTKTRPRFDAYCTYHRLATLNIAEGLSDSIHTVELELDANQPDKATILAQRQNKIDKPERFDDTAWYAGAIMVLGDLVPAKRSITLEDLSVTQDVVYGHKVGMALTMDVFQPKQGNGVGVLFMVSGGWYSHWAPPAQTMGLFRPLLDNSFTVFAVRHGSSPKFFVPDAVEDVRRSIRFVRLNAARFNVDPDRLGVSGGSAGGHLSLVLACMGDDGNPAARDEVGRTSSRVAAVVAFYSGVLC